MPSGPSLARTASTGDRNSLPGRVDCLPYAGVSSPGTAGRFRAARLFAFGATRTTPPRIASRTILVLARRVLGMNRREIVKIVSKLLGSKPKTADIAVEITRHEDDRAREQARAAKARAALANLGLLTDAEHVEAEAEAAAAARAIVRIDARLVELRAAHDESVKSDNRAALKAQAEAARRRIGEVPKLIERYEILATELVDVAKKLNAIDQDIGNANRSLAMARQAEPGVEHPDPIQTVTERFRTKPDEVIPEQRIVDEVWEEPDSRGGFSRVSVFTVRNGVKTPNNAAARKVSRERVIPGEVRPGRVLSSPTLGLKLPPARLGQAPFWPVR